MNVRFYGKLVARFGFLLGMLAAASCFFPAYLFWGMLCSILGTILSVGVIFVRIRYGSTVRWRDLPIISIVLCSFPVLYVILILFVLKQP